MLTEVKKRIGEKNSINMLLLRQDPVYRKKMSDAAKGRKMPTGCDRTGTLAWNSGLNKGNSEYGKKLSKARMGNANPMYNRKSWNSGKTYPEFSGENHPRWVADRTKIKAYQSERNNSEYKQWRIKVLNRDNWQCIFCGERKRKMIADHIYSWSQYVRLRYCVENGQALCFDCHKVKTRYENTKNTNIIYSTWEK